GLATGEPISKDAVRALRFLLSELLEPLEQRFSLTRPRLGRADSSEHGLCLAELAAIKRAFGPRQIEGQLRYAIRRLRSGFDGFPQRHCDRVALDHVGHGAPQGLGPYRLGEEVDRA